MGPSVVGRDPCFQLGWAQSVVGVRDRACAMHPRGRNRVEPGALHGPRAGDHPHAAPARVATLMVGADPRADGVALMPRGVIPEAQPGGETWPGQAGTAPGENVCRPGADGAPFDNPAWPRLGLRRTGASQHAITRQGLGLGGGLRTRQCLASGDGPGRHPALRVGLGPTAPPDRSGPAERPRRLGRRSPHEAGAPCCLLRSAGSGRVIPCVARCQRTPSGLRARRIASPLTWCGVSPCATLTSAATASVYPLVGLPQGRGLWCNQARRRALRPVSTMACVRWGREDWGWRALTPHGWKACMAWRTVWS